MSGKRKPDAAAGQPAEPTRRRLLNWLWGALGLTLAAELVWMSASFLRPRRRPAAAAAELFVAGEAASFEPGSVTAFPAGSFYLVRLAEGGFLALSRTCTHLGCSVPWKPEEQRFACPCHASSFDIRGELLGPPAPRPLDLHPVRVENGIVKVDLTQRVKRSRYEPSQAVSA